LLGFNHRYCKNVHEEEIEQKNLIFFSLSASQTQVALIAYGKSDNPPCSTVASILLTSDKTCSCFDYFGSSCLDVETTHCVNFSIVGSSGIIQPYFYGNCMPGQCNPNTNCTFVQGSFGLCLPIPGSGSSCYPCYIWDCGSIKMFELVSGSWTLNQYSDPTCSTLAGTALLSSSITCQAASNGIYVRFGSLGGNEFALSTFVDSNCQTDPNYGVVSPDTCVTLGSIYYKVEASSSNKVYVESIGYMFLLVTFVLQMLCK